MVTTNFQDGVALYAANLNTAFANCADIAGGAGGGLPNTTGYMTGALTVNNLTSNVAINTNSIVANTRISIAGVDIGSGLVSNWVLTNSTSNLVIGAYANANAALAEANAFQSIINSAFLLANSTTNLVASAFNKANNSANASDLLIAVTTQQTANFTLSLANAGTIIEVNSSNIITCTIPNDGALLIPNNTIIELCQIGTSSIQVQGVAAVTVQPPSNTTRTQFSTIGLRKRVANVWILSGDLT